jgi:hypothetical protein
MRRSPADSRPDPLFGAGPDRTRVWLRDVAARITYWCTPDGKIVLLTCSARPASTSSGRSTERSARRRPARADIRTALGLSVAELALRAALTDDDIEHIEEGGTEPTIPLLRRLAAALNADVRLTAGHDLGSVWFETHAA